MRLAAATARRVWDRWRQVSPLDLEAGSALWLEDALEATREGRARSRLLSGRYVRLLRGLRVGRTLPPLLPEPPRERVTIGELRRDLLADSGEAPEVWPEDDETVPVDDDFEWPEEDTEDAERAATVSLVVTGPVRAQGYLDDLADDSRRGRLDDVSFLAEMDQMMRDAGAVAAGAAEREALRGGRDLLDAASRADRAVVGWARVTDGDPCWFCAMLASRGAVYRNFWTARYTGRASRRRAAPPDPPQGWEDWPPERMAEWEASRGMDRFHNNCHCTIVPVYSRTDWVPEASQEFRNLYYASTRGLTGREARAAFRAAIEARRQQA
ncbi:hypothetical protein [Streptomyces chumphonensis]|uniref:VG15 protein n=1 Tax=Streptomyces chumphonensis TaxID=1214925 RepID=UPI003D720E87